MILLRGLYCIYSWFLMMLIVRIPLILLGYITVPIALIFKAYEKQVSKYTGNEIYNFTWKFMLPWNNPEDGIHCTTYFDHGFFWTSMRWTLVRNPVNGLREVPYISCKIVPSRVEFVGSFGKLYNKKMTRGLRDMIFQYDTKVPQWFLCWQGLHSCLYIQWRMFGKLLRFWVGTAKIYPTDIYGITQYRKWGAGMVSQFKVID